MQVRSVSARALGAMVRGMGESSFEELLPWLMQTLTSEASSVDRSGAAQGLAEVSLIIFSLYNLCCDVFHVFISRVSRNIFFSKCVYALISENYKNIFSFFRLLEVLDPTNFIVSCLILWLQLSAQTSPLM